MALRSHWGKSKIGFSQPPAPCLVAGDKEETLLPKSGSTQMVMPLRMTCGVPKRQSALRHFDRILRHRPLKSL